MKEKVKPALKTMLYNSQFELAKMIRSAETTMEVVGIPEGDQAKLLNEVLEENRLQVEAAMAKLPKEQMAAVAKMLMTLAILAGRNK